MVWPAVVQASSFDHLSSCGPVTGPRAGNCSEPSGDGFRLLITVEGGGDEPVTVLATSDARRRSSLSTLLTAKPAQAGDAKPWFLTRLSCREEWWLHRLSAGRCLSGRLMGERTHDVVRKLNDERLRRPS